MSRPPTAAPRPTEGSSNAEPHRRVDDEPGRGVALPRPRPGPRTGRHDRAAAVGTAVDERRSRRLAHRTAGVRRARVLPAYPRWRAGADAGGRVPDAGPAVPA